MSTGVRYIAGIGFRRSTAATEIVDLVRRALSLADAQASSLAAIVTASDRVEDASFREAARILGLAPEGIAPDRLTASDARVLTRSPRIEALRGVGSLCEAAALAAAGPDGHLAVARIASGNATCALALRPDQYRRPGE